MRDRARRSGRAAVLQRRPRRRSSGCRAARRRRTSRCRAGPCRCRAAASRPWFEMTWAVPVLPQTSCPVIRARPPVPPAFTTIQRPSRIACSFAGSTSIAACGGGVGTGFQPRALVDRLDQVRRDPGAAVRERRHVHRHRHRRHRDLPLPDADRDGFAGVPLLAGAGLLPLGRRHDAGDLVRQVDAGLHAEAEQRRPLVDPIDPQHVADRVEEHVARLLDGVAQVDGAVAALAPALEVAAVERRAARTVHLEVGRDDPFLERRECRPPS